MSQLDPRYEQGQRAVLGSLMLDAPHVAGLVMHRTQAEDYTGAYRSIFQACRVWTAAFAERPPAAALPTM